MILELKDYSAEISLFEKIKRPEPCVSDEEYISFVREACSFLFHERTQSADLPEDAAELKRIFRGLLNERIPAPIPVHFEKIMNRILWTDRINAGIVEGISLLDLSEAFHLKTPVAEKIILWKGDITTLNVDAVVNASNIKLLGCFVPLHSCIDNAIHSSAGFQLRNDCAVIMGLQNEDEPAGFAKITRAYNLPSRFILHTVGPIVDGLLREEHALLLKNCYVSCLDLAERIEEIRSMAFCCISTGVFGFPIQEASEIAIRTVSAWLEKNPEAFDKIIFNVFSEYDYNVYCRALKCFE